MTWVGVVEPEGALVAIFTTLEVGLAVVAPALIIAEIVGIAVFATVITSSPVLTPMDFNEIIVGVPSDLDSGELCKRTVFLMLFLSVSILLVNFKLTASILLLIA